jgi:hypothetical protein
MNGKTMRPFGLLLMAAIIAGYGLSAAADALGTCRELSGDGERLACYDAVVPDPADAAALLTQLLGDPEAIGKDYDVLGNSATIAALLPGHWQLWHWKDAQGLLAGDLLAKSCARSPVVIAAMGGNPYAFTVTRQSTKHGAIHVQDLILSTRSRFAYATDLPGTLQHLGIDPQTMGFMIVAPTFERAVGEATYLRLSDDVLLAIDSAAGETLVMLRCPAQ